MKDAKTWLTKSNKHIKTSAAEFTVSYTITEPDLWAIISPRTSRL